MCLLEEGGHLLAGIQQHCLTISMLNLHRVRGNHQVQ
jgi:hypothetical protein